MKKLKSKAFDFVNPFVFLSCFMFLGYVFVHITKSPVVATLLCDATISIFGLYYIWKNFMKNDNISVKQLGAFHILGLGISFLFLWFVCQQMASWFFLNFSDKAFDEYTASAQMNPCLYILLSACIAPVFEEILFRGVFFLSYRRSFGPVFACFASAFVFALFHGTIVHLPATFLFGLFLAVVYHYTGRLMVCMGLHVCFNGLALALSDWAMPTIFLTTPVAVAMYVVALAGVSSFLLFYVAQKNLEERKGILS